MFSPVKHNNSRMTSHITADFSAISAISDYRGKVQIYLADKAAAIFHAGAYLPSV